MTETSGPGRPDGTPIDKETLRRKYLEERDKRLRPDGNDQYLRLTGRLARYLDDPYTPRVEREPITDHVTGAFIGGGFAGLVTRARLKEAGVDSVRILDKGGDVGGTWYWNRYPGAQCDTASMVYMPLLEETGHMPSEKYAHGPEILEHCQRIAKQYGPYHDALFHTEVEELEWDDGRSRWTVRTNRGDAFTAQFVAMGTGPHGIHVHGFPNAFLVQPTQGANLISNVPHNLTESGRTIAAVVAHALENGWSQVEATQEAEDAWVDLLLTHPGMLISSPDYTPGYYNNEGQDAGRKAKLHVGYPAGASAFFAYLEQWRDSGDVEGLEFR